MDLYDFLGLCVICVCDLMLMFKIEFVFFVFGSGFVHLCYCVDLKIYDCVLVEKEFNLNLCILSFLILFFPFLFC